jgi:Methyltransferase domain
MAKTKMKRHRLALEDYLAARSELPGWFDWIDIVLFQLFDQVQQEAALRGDLLEIGVYQGKSAILLEYFVREGERLVVCDLFESAASSATNAEENQHYYSDLSRQAFERIFLRFHERLPDVFQCSSTELPERAGLCRSFRFIHVDGSHLYEVVRQDIATAKSLLVDGGIVVFDDYRSEHTPGVAAAVWEAIAGRIVQPICITQKKMYAWTGQTRPAGLARLDALPAIHPSLRLESHSLLGVDLVRVYQAASAISRTKQMYWDLLAKVRRARGRSAPRMS